MTMQTEAITLIMALNKAFQDCKVGRYEEIRLQEAINQTLNTLHQSKTVDNKLLIALEKFYQSVSFLVGITGLTLSEEAHQAWRAYDSWHDSNVRTQLRLFGSFVGPI